MLKRRIIPVELLDSGRLVKTLAFADPRDVGDPVKSSKVYSDQDADELIFLQIDRNLRCVDTLAVVIAKVAEQCFVPLTAGGGISEFDDAKSLFEAGADKILINSAAYKKTALLKEISECFGRQAIVIGIDVQFEYDSYVLYSNCGRSREEVGLVEHIEKVIDAGAGELMLQVINRDGMMQGYDLDLLRTVVSNSRVPVIAGSGAGTFAHLKEAFDIGVQAVACGSLFNFGDNNPLRAKSFLKNYGVPLKRI